MLKKELSVKKFSSLPDIKKTCENRENCNSYDDADSSQVKKFISDPTLVTKVMVLMIGEKQYLITTEDVKTDMKEFLKNQKKKIIFHHFCKEIVHSQELLMFVEAVHHYRSLFGEEDLSVIIDTAKSIGEKYIVTESEHTLNLFDTVRAKILTRTRMRDTQRNDTNIILMMSENGWKTLFDEAYSDVINTLEYDTFPKFRNWVISNSQIDPASVGDQSVRKTHPTRKMNYSIKSFFGLQT